MTDSVQRIAAKDGGTVIASNVNDDGYVIVYEDGRKVRYTHDKDENDNIIAATRRAKPAAAINIQDGVSTDEATLAAQALAARKAEQAAARKAEQEKAKALKAEQAAARK